MSDQEFRIKKGLRVQDVLAINDQGNIANADRIPEIPISKTTNLQTSLDDKVSLTANVNIGGVKTFSNNTIFNGDVGIGTSSPIGKLDVSDGTNPLSFDSSTYNEIQSYNRPLLLNRQGNNVGIGTSSPSVRLQVETPSDGVSSWVLTKRGSTELYTGINSTFGASIESNDFLRFGTGASFIERMRITSAGSVGIGTSTPIGVSNYTALTIDGSSGSFTEYREGGTNTFRVGSDSAAGGFLFTQGTLPIRFGTGDAERMRIDSVGNVGIGTSSPAQRLSVSGNITATGQIISDGAAAEQYVASSKSGVTTSYLATDASGANLRVDGVWPIRFTTNSSERMRIDSAGNVGIGTSTPRAGIKLDVASTGEAVIGVIDLDQANTWGNFSHNNGLTQFVSRNGDSFGSFVWYGADGSTFPERMRLDSSGDLLVGTTSGSGARLFISGRTALGADAIVARSNSTGAGGSAYIGEIYNTGAFLCYWLYNGTNVGSISTNGTSTAYNTSSDYRLKEDWQPIENSIDRLMSLNPVNFAWKVDGTRVDGFIAHEAQEVVPEAVTGTKDAVDKDGNPDYQGIDQSKLVPLLTAALQEAVKRIESLEQRIITLEGNNNAI
jgi:hypothetical protein